MGVRYNEGAFPQKVQHRRSLSGALLTFTFLSLLVFILPPSDAKPLSQLFTSSSFHNSDDDGVANNKNEETNNRDVKRKNIIKDPEDEVQIYRIFNTETNAVHYTSSWHRHWWLQKRPWHDIASAAVAQVKHKMNTAGWEGVRITTTSSLPEEQQAYAAGYAEGLVTWQRIYQAYQNTITYNGMPKITGEIKIFIESQIQFLKNQVHDNKDKDPFWNAVGSVLEQITGMADGYNVMGSQQQPSIGFFEIYILNFQTEIEEVAEKFNMTMNYEEEDIFFNDDDVKEKKKGEGRNNVANPQQSIRAVRRSLHCSAIVKVTEDDVYVAHTTWGSVTSMLRQIKEYNFGYQPRVKFSSYPGIVHSDDDWYMLGSGLCVQETTNGNYNQTLNNFISPQTVAEFIRVVVANRLATNGSSWVHAFSRLNSGTYNNQWMIVDFNLYQLGQTKPATLPDGFFTVLEQMPLLIHWEDLTHVLRKSGSGNYWPSYNVPYFPDIYKASGNQKMAELYGNFYSYNKTSRRLIFDQLAPTANSLKLIQHLIRLNDCRTNPLCNCSSCTPDNFTYGKAIAARCDLAPEPSMSEHDYCWPDEDAIDAKITSYQMMMMMGVHSSTENMNERKILATMIAKKEGGKGGEKIPKEFLPSSLPLGGVVIGAPSYDQLPVFNWSTYIYRNKYTVIGMPDSYNFGWYNGQAKQKKKQANRIMDAADDIYALLAPRENLLQVFYYLLWQKTGSNRAAQHTLTNVNLPDTVILNHSRAIGWYFTSKDGTIRRKGRKNLSSTQIIEQFSKKKHSVSGATAVLISRDSAQEEGVAYTPTTMAEGTTSKTHNLRSMLAEDLLHGTLQAFIEPKKESGIYTNHVIVANWTPNVFYFEKRSNALNMEGEKFSLSDRTSIAETNKHVHVVPLVSSRITVQLEAICATIARHVDVIHGCKVSNLVLHFKIDEHDVPWIMYCSTFRASKPNDPRGSVSLSVIPPRQDSNSHHQKNNAALTVVKAEDARKKERKAKEEEGDATCVLCQQQVPVTEMTWIAQKHILFPLAVVEFFGLNPPGTVFREVDKLGEVPPYVMLIYPHMTTIDYETMKQDPHWQDAPVQLCRGCAAGLESMTASIEIDVDGCIRVPDFHSASSPFLHQAVAATSKTNHFRPSKLRSKIMADRQRADDYNEDDEDEEPSWETVQPAPHTSAPQQRVKSGGTTTSTSSSVASRQKAKALADREAHQQMSLRKKKESSLLEPSSNNRGKPPRSNSTQPR